MEKPAVGTREYCLIFAELINAARRRGVVTYQELADLIGLPLQGSYMGKTLAIFLGLISQEEAKHGRPMLSAIVVNVGGIPGEGFYPIAIQLGLPVGEGDTARHAFWESEKAKVYETWKKSFARKNDHNQEHQESAR